MDIRWNCVTPPASMPRRRLPYSTLPTTTPRPRPAARAAATPLLVVEEAGQEGPATYIAPPVSAASAATEQTAQSSRPPVKIVASFEGLGIGFTGPPGPAPGRNPSDNSLAAGTDHVVQIVNSRMAVFDKQGKALYGAVKTNTLFRGFGGALRAAQ